jgi:hypothetical protein
MTDDLRRLQAAVRDYFRLEHQLDEVVRTHLNVAESEFEAMELALHKARARALTLAGVDELD